MLLIAAGVFSLARLPAAASVSQILWRLGLVGVGTAVFLPPNSSAAMTAVPAARRGTAAATVAMARNLGMVLGVAQASAIFNSTFSALSGVNSLSVYEASLAPAFMAAFQSSLCAGGVVALVGAILAFARGKDFPSPGPERDLPRERAGGISGEDGG
jgi:hypothetical protein